MDIGIRPLGARVLLQRLAVAEQKTETGILLPERSAEPTYKNEVVAVGEDVKPVKVGDIVVTTQFVGDEVKHNYESFFLVAEEDLLAVIERS